MATGSEKTEMLWQDIGEHVLTIQGLSATRNPAFGRASANSFTKKRGHTQYEFDPLLSVLPNPRPTLPFQRRQHPRQLFLTSYLSPLSDCGPRNGAAFLCAWDRRLACPGGMKSRQDQIGSHFAQPGQARRLSHALRREAFHFINHENLIHPWHRNLLLFPTRPLDLKLVHLSRCAQSKVHAWIRI